MKQYKTRPVKLEKSASRLKTMKKQLADADQRFQKMFENAPEGMTVVDLNTGKFIELNENALNLLKYTTGELMRMGPVDISAPVQPDGSLSKDKVKECIRKTFTGEKPVFEWLVCDANGKEIMTEVRLVALTDINGPTILASFGDITKRKEAEFLREKMAADLIRRNKDLEQFAYIVSHNLRAHVANIVGISHLMNVMQSGKEKEKEIKTALLTSVNKLDQVIKDLNEILQTKDTMNEQREIVSFHELLNDIVLSISNNVTSERFQILEDFSEVDEILTIKSYLYSIFLNLITNSIKYKNPGAMPVIKISSIKSKNKITLIFKDNGLGIDLTKKGDQVFGLYKRFHAHIEGRGVGLFMVKTQVETLGGNIGIKSEVSKGTEFSIEFKINEQ